MPMSADVRWEEMLAEFRALGGTADNIRLGEGRFGRGLFPCDPSHPVRVLIPKNLLVDPEFYETTAGTCQIGASAPVGERERFFLEAYQRDYGWGSAAREETERLLALMDSAPPELRHFLETKFRLNRWFGGATVERTRERFFGSRVIHDEDRTFVMPIVELANHGAGAELNTDDGVSIGGQFPDEILVRYYRSDALTLFKNWGFASEEDFALSLPTGLERKAGRLIVARDEARTTAGTATPFFPKVSRDGPQLTLSYMLLGHKKFPRLARGISYRIMRDAGREDAEEVFELIQHLNRMAFLELIGLTEGAPLELGALLRKVARYQLEAMSYSVGVRDIQLPTDARHA